MFRCTLLLGLACASWSQCAAQQSEKANGWLNFQRLPDLPDELGVAGPFVGVSGDALIVAGGANFPRPVWETSKVWHDRIYVLTKNDGGYEWHDGGTLPRPVAYGAAVSIEDGVLCLGGNDSSSCFADCFLLRWNSEKSRISIKEFPPLPERCAYGQATVIDGVVYLAGGQSGTGLETAGKNFWKLRLNSAGKDSALKWEVGTAWPGPSRAFNITTRQHNGREDCVYVISGRRQNGDDVQFLKDVWEYSPSKQTWTQRDDAPRCVMAGTGFPFGRNRLVIAGGADGSMFFKGDILKDSHPGFPKEALQFNTKSGHWGSAGLIPANHVTTVPVTWGNRIVIASGEIRPRIRSAAIWSIEVPK